MTSSCCASSLTTTWRPCGQHSTTWTSAGGTPIGGRGRIPRPHLLASGRDWTSGTSAAWLICTPDQHDLQGLVALHSISEFQGTAEIGYWVAAPARGRGLAAAAVGAAATWAMRTVGLRRVELLHAVPNTASCRVAERAGFTLEGTQRQSFVYGDDLVYDEHRHARLSSDG